MKRIFTVFVAALVMVALLALMAAPAFSAVKRVGPDKDQPSGKKDFMKKPQGGGFIGGSKHSPPPND